MEEHNLHRMANRIGQFYRSLPDHAEAVTGTATHIRRFWDPRMRRELFAHIDAHGYEGLDPLVIEAIQTHRVMMEPPPAVMLGPR